MDSLSRELQTFLVRLGYDADSVSHEAAHGMEHILHLLQPADEDTLIHYYGLFGAERFSLDDLAAERGMSPEDMMASIDASIRKIAVTPEWQEIKAELR
ncbi:MAG: hypothetical protein ACI4TW_03195 [Prevotella sp.]